MQYFMFLCVVLEKTINLSAMKTLKKTRLSVFNKLLSLALALLGFGSCSYLYNGPEEEPSMYGMPPAKYEVKAKVLDKENKPIRGIRVEVKAEKYGNHIMTNGSTDANGVFVSKVYDNHVKIVCEDTDGDKNGGVFEKDSISVDVSKQVDFLTIKLKSKE
jgi:putative lipoprotein (rSAM/lipoprotein system)